MMVVEIYREDKWGKALRGEMRGRAWARRQS